ncbi:MAG: GNAT family N-acetyltransferase [Candidatus Rhabdochlamydia sp.]
MHEGLDIRYTEENDLLFLQKWVQDPKVLHWFPMTKELEIEEALRCWIGFHRYFCSLTAVIQGVPCAVGTLFLMPYKKVSHYALFKMVVNPDLQRQGIGSDLLKNLIHLAKNYFHLEKIGIEIFEGNPIIHLLKKQGFQEVFRHEGYVKIEEQFFARLYMERVL